MGILKHCWGYWTCSLKCYYLGGGMGGVGKKGEFFLFPPLGEGEKK